MTRKPSPSSAGATSSGWRMPCRRTDSTSWAPRSRSECVRGFRPSSTSIAESGRLRGTPFASVTVDLLMWGPARCGAVGIRPARRGVRHSGVRRPRDRAAFPTSSARRRLGAALDRQQASSSTSIRASPNPASARIFWRRSRWSIRQRRRAWTTGTSAPRSSRAEVSAPGSPTPSTSSATCVVADRVCPT